MKIARSLVPFWRRSRRRRGNVMAMVLATIFVLATIVLALHHQQSVARSSLVRAEAELRFREARNFALREHLTGESTPWGLSVGADLEDTTPDTTNKIPLQYAQALFQREEASWSGLPDLMAQDTAHAHRYLELTPTGFGGLSRGVRKGTYRMVETEIPGYAAYAPRGQVTLGEVLGWQNPSYEGESDSSEAYSGVPAIVAAQGDIAIEELAYGEAHSRSGNISIDEGAGIGFIGTLPLAAYEAEIQDGLDDARSTLFASSSTGNKSRLIDEHTDIGDLVSVMFGGNFNPERLLTLHQAMEFPTPMIPSGKMVVPGLVWEIWLHVPFQPDIGFSSQSDPDLTRLKEIASEQEEAGVLLREAQHRLEAAEDALEAAQAAYDSNPSDANEAALEAAESEHQSAQAEFDAIEDFLEESSEEAADLADGKIGSGISDLPQRRSEDPSGRDGQWGWNYSQTIGRMWELVRGVASGGGTAEIARSVSSNVRVVHYGPEDEVPGFEWTGDTFLSRSTWTVPASRTLRYEGNMTIQGDLWLQRGTVMVVDGNLRVESPDTPSLNDAFDPSGRVFFEEGSTLIVTRDFECEGSQQFGSIMVGGEPNEIHPITSGLFVDGDIRIPHGIYAGHTIPDLIAGLGSSGLGGGQLGAGANQVQQLMGEMAPLFSKLAGPFHLRNPYFAQFATTFQLVTIPFPPVVAVTPIPTERDNLHVFAFRAETLAYTVGLNATLGENLYPQADWWPFGNGVVPMALNLDLGAALGAYNSLAALEGAAELDPETVESNVEEFITVLTERSLQWAIDEGLQKLTDEAKAILLPSGVDQIVKLVEDLVDALEPDEETVEDFYSGFVGDMQDTMGGIARDLLGDLLASTDVNDQDEYLKQYAGLLVYGRNIFVSSDARQVSGMFVAQDDIIIDANLTVGTLMSLNGSIETGDFLYYPYFNQASLYLPAPVPGSTAIERAQFRAYGASHDSGLAVQVGPPPVTHIITSGGWDND
jgi:hypothetical protein